MLTIAPAAADLAVLGFFAIVLASLGLIGSLIAGRATPPDRGIVAGWGLASVAFTAGGVAGLPFGYVAVLFFAVVAFAAVVRLASRPDPDWLALAVAACLVPILVIAAGKLPSGTDEAMHWLPNAAYIFNHDAFPRIDGPPSGSSYPAFPYNLAFITYLVSALAGHLAEQAVVLFNTALCGVLALLILRQVRAEEAGLDRRELGARIFVVATLAVLAATVLNPTFLPKVVFTNYADFATALGLALGGWLLVDLVKRCEADLMPWRQALYAGLVLAAVINTKQANPALVMILGVSAIGVAALAGWHGAGRLVALSPAWLGPPLALYGLWRWHVAVAMGGVGENRLRPFAAWEMDAVPDILASMGEVLLKKSGYTALIVVAVVVALRGLLKRRRDPTTRLAQLCAAAFVLYFGFLFCMYLANFAGEAARRAQSFWRYQTHLGPLALLVAATLVAEKAGPLLQRLTSRGLAMAAITAVVLVIAGPIAAAQRMIRTDLEMPKPFLDRIARDAARLVPADANLVIALPFNTLDLAEMMRLRLWEQGRTIRLAPPRSDQPLDDVSDGGFALLLCAPMRLEEGMVLPSETAVLLQRERAHWRVVARWPHPPALFEHPKLRAERCAGMAAGA